MLTMEAMALIIMLSSILTFSWLSNSNEIPILKASGKSAFRILLPPVLITIFIGLLVTFIGGPLVSVSMRTSDSVLERFNLTNKNSFSVSDNDIWLRDKNESIDMVIKASTMNSTATVFYDLIFFEFYGQEKLNRKRENTLCPQCQGSGYKGRIGAYELLLLDRKIQNAIAAGMSNREVEEIAVNENSMLTLTQYGVELVKEHLTTVSEVIRVCKTDH